MDNYTAIMKMSKSQLEMFLDDVYCTGLNNGMYAAEHPEKDDIFAEFPFNEKWLSADAESATLCPEGEDGDENLTEFFAQSALRYAGIDITESASETENKESISITIKKKD